jgi:hypothetical protein
MFIGEQVFWENKIFPYKSSYIQIFKFVIFFKYRSKNKKRGVL